MMFIVFATFAVFAAAEPTRPGCCVPPQWEGRQGSIIGSVNKGSTSVTNANYFMSYDETNQRVYYETEAETEGVTQYLKIIQNFAKGMQYVIDLQKQNCSSFPISQQFPKICLPADAQLAGKIYFGIGTNRFDALSFTYYTHGTNVTVVGTPDDCIPVIDVLRVKDSSMGTAQMTFTGFVDLTVGIRDPSIFNVPSICKQVDPSLFKSIARNEGFFRF
ncbi:hypothetical protein SNE40_007650 [Patella caerulea]|uniref:Uncharacterized protein n=1 Tax=Patella caerulea TaxID=87958 RepID=A0AAN8JZF2_PATCE